jgi:hypothetical protein
VGNGTHQPLAYSDHVHILGDNIDNIKKSTETLIDASSEVGLVINIEKTKYMLLVHHQNAGQNLDVNIGNRSFENVSQFKYLGTVQNLSPHLLYKSIRIRMCKTVTLPVVLYGCETWSLTLREEHRLRVFEFKVLRRIFGLKWDEMIGGWRKLHNEELHNLYSSPSIIRMVKTKRVRWEGHVARMGEKRNTYM